MSSKENILIIGATRGLGAELLKYYSTLPTTSHVYGTARSSSHPSDHPSNVSYLPGIDLLSPNCGKALVSALPKSIPLHTIIITASIFVKDDLSAPDWDAEVKMYTTSCIAPVALASALDAAGLLASHTKLVLVGSESGSVTLRHPKEGGGAYGHHGSKAATNMVAKLLSLDLADKGVAVAVVHPGFMRTEMTRGVGFDKFWDEGGAVTPDVAAKSLADWVRGEFGFEKTGQYWAPRGPGDIGTAEPVLGKGLATPLQLPW